MTGKQPRQKSFPPLCQRTRPLGMSLSHFTQLVLPPVTPTRSVPYAWAALDKETEANEAELSELDEEMVVEIPDSAWSNCSNLCTKIVLFPLTGSPRCLRIGFKSATLKCQ